MKKIKLISCIIIAALLCGNMCIAASPAEINPGGEILPVLNYAPETVQPIDLNIKGEGVILIEAETGTVLYENNADVPLPPASVTKIMSLLLIMESIKDGKISLEDKVTASEYACSMGGSQVYLEPGEIMTVDEMLKCVVVSSANDATVALAEHVTGSVDAFVAKMNVRAAELGMTNTVFKNTTGIDEDGHFISARDVAIMSRELIKHTKIFDYTTIWMDTIRDGEFGLSNTNKLIRFYAGANGLKTGSTSIAKYCLSGSAIRNDMQLIAIVMGAPTSDDRFAGVKKMLDYGFATYAVAKTEKEIFEPLKVKGGTKDYVTIASEEKAFLIAKGKEKDIKKQIILDDSVKAPVKAGDKVGSIKYYLNDTEISSSDITVSEEVKRISSFGLFFKMFNRYLMLE